MGYCYTYQYSINGSHQLITVDQSVSALARSIGDVLQNTSECVRTGYLTLYTIWSSPIAYYSDHILTTTCIQCSSPRCSILITTLHPNTAFKHCIQTLHSNTAFKHCITKILLSYSGVGRCLIKGGLYKKGGGACGDRARSMRRRAVPDASGELSSFSGEGRGNGSVPRSSWHDYRCCGLPAFRSRPFKAKIYVNLCTLPSENRSSSKFTELHTLTQAARSYML